MMYFSFIQDARGRPRTEIHISNHRSSGTPDTPWIWISKQKI